MMNLKGINVLVDGYNIELSQGTGIKTYGMSLIHALNLLEANVDILFSRGSSSSNDPILNQVLFFDNPSKNTPKKRLDKIKFIKDLVHGGSGLFYRAKRVDSSELIINSEFSQLMNYSGILNLRSCYRVANALQKTYKITTNIATPNKIDVWHATYPLPINIKGAKKITTIHDLIPLRLPNTTLDDKNFFYKVVKDSLTNSSLIITVSENSKQDILKFFDVTSDKIYVSYQPTVLEPLVVEEDKLTKFLKKYELELKKYILFVGAIEPKKNLGRLIDAYAEMDTDMQLVVIGKRGWLWKGEIGKLNSIFDKNFARKIKILEYVSTEDLKYFYLGAYCFVFPSLYEGFGLPPLEAMTFGCPVVTSNVSSLPEICQDAALYVNPYDTNDIREKIEKLINNPQLCTDLSDAGKERAKFFSMENYAKRLYEAYARVL